MRISSSKCLSQTSSAKKNPTRGLNRVKMGMKADTHELDKMQTWLQTLRQKRTYRVEDNEALNSLVIPKQRNEKVLPKNNEPIHQPRKQKYRKKGKST